MKNADLEYIYPQTRKSILTSANPTTHLLDLPRNVVWTQQCAFIRRYKT